MTSCERFLVFDGEKFSKYKGAQLPAFTAKLQSKENGAIYVWKHDLYQEIGTSKATRYDELMARIKHIVNCFRQLNSSDNAFSSLKEAISALFQPLNPTSYTVYKKAQRSLKEIAAEYQELHQAKPFPHVLIPHPIIREGLTLSMKGIALLAERLSQKSNLSNFIVHDSLRSFQTQLKAIAHDPSDGRYAMIVPCHQSLINPDPLAVVEQHMLSVLIEKINGKLHICVLEPMIIDELNLEKADLRATEFAPEELVLAFIKDAGLNPTTMTIYHSGFGRQYGPNGGCSTFALRDAVNFLKNPAFFQEICVDEHQKKLPWGTVKKITALPPAFMVSMQSLKKIENYAAAHPAFANQKLGKRQENLQKTVERRTYKILKVTSKAPKFINKYIDARTAKYQELLLEGLKREA